MAKIVDGMGNFWSNTGPTSLDAISKDIEQIKLKPCTLVTNILGRKHANFHGDLTNRKKVTLKGLGVPFF